MKIKSLEFSKLDSTNNYLKSNYRNYDSFTFVRAKDQTNGKGKFDAVWESEENSNLTFSLLIKNVVVSSVEYLNWWAINSITKTLQFYDEKIQFVQPNDFYYLDKKIGGLLIETKVNKDICEYVVLGIGINLNQIAFKNPNAISLQTIVNRKININKFYRRLINNMIKGYLLK